MKFFTKKELITTIIILFGISILVLQNLKISQRKARDFQRRDDLATIYNALHAFHSDFGRFPEDQSGKIKACRGEDFGSELSRVKTSGGDLLIAYFNNLKACEWGFDSLKDLSDDNYTPYLKVIPTDIFSKKGISYHYVSNGRFFQLYAHLEGGTSEIGFDKKVLLRNLPCGERFCNFGRSAFGKTPLDITLEEYEKQLTDNPQLDGQLERKRVN